MTVKGFVVRENLDEFPGLDLLAEAPYASVYEVEVGGFDGAYFSDVLGYTCLYNSEGEEYPPLAVYPSELKTRKEAIEEMEKYFLHAESKFMSMMEIAKRQLAVIEEQRKIFREMVAEKGAE